MIIKKRKLENYNQIRVAIPDLLTNYPKTHTCFFSISLYCKMVVEKGKQDRISHVLILRRLLHFPLYELAV